MTTRKLTTLIGGQIEGSLKSSVNQAEQQLARLRKEQRADVREAQRLTQSLKTLEKGTVSYTNAQKRLAAIKSGVAGREDAIAALNARMRTGTGRAQMLGQRVGQLAQQFSRAGKAGLIIGASLAVLAGGIAIFNRLRRSLDSYIQRVVHLGDIQARGYDPEGYQRLGQALNTVTHDAGRTNSVLDNLRRTGEQLQISLTYDPSQLSRGQLRAFSELGIEIRQVTGDVTKDYQHLINGAARLVRSQGAAYAKGAIQAAGYSEDVATSLLRVIQNSEDAQAAQAAFGAALKLDEERRRELELYANAQERVNHQIAVAKARLTTALAPAFLTLYQNILPVVQQISDWITKAENMDKVNRGVATGIEVVAVAFKVVSLQVKNLIGLGKIATGVLLAGGATVVGFFSATAQAIVTLVRQASDALNRIPGVDIDTSGLRRVEADLAAFNRRTGGAIKSGAGLAISGAGDVAQAYQGAAQLAGQVALGGQSGARPAPTPQVVNNFDLSGTTDPQMAAQEAAVLVEQSIVRTQFGY